MLLLSIYTQPAVYSGFSPIAHLDLFKDAIDSYSAGVHNLFDAVIAENMTKVKYAQEELSHSSIELQNITKFIKKDAKQLKRDSKEVFNVYLKLVRDLKILTNAQTCISSAAPHAITDGEQISRFVACSNIFQRTLTNLYSSIEDLHKLLKVRGIHAS
jgi:hypothetical protein